MLVPLNSSNLLLSVHLSDDAGSAITGKAYDAAGLVVSYRLESAGDYTDITLVDGTLGTYVANSWHEVGLGEYQLCLPNAAIVGGKETKLKIVVDDNLPLFDAIHAMLPVSSGYGDREITFTISAGARAVEGARVTVLSGSLVVAGGSTGTSGNLRMYLQDGSYTVRVASSPFFQSMADQSLDVTADAAVTYVLTGVTIPTPDEPAMCTVRFVTYGNGNPLEGAKVTVELIGDNITTDSTLIAKQILRGVTNSSGYVDLSLIQSKQFTRGGRYRISVVAPDGGTIHARVVSVPAVSTVFAEDLPNA